MANQDSSVDEIAIYRFLFNSPYIMPTTTTLTQNFSSKAARGARMPQAILACLLLAATVLPSQATTLIKCRIDGKTVYSDTVCTNSRTASGRNVLQTVPASKPVKVKIPKKKTVRMRVAQHQP